MRSVIHRRAKTSLLLTTALALAACSSTLDKIESIGKAPQLNPIAVPPNIAAGGPVLLPQPALEKPTQRTSSLWRPGSRSFFRDPRAQRVGDILTVSIDIGDQAKIANTTTRTTSAKEDAGVPNLLGFESKLANILPKAVDASKLVALNS